MTIRLKLLRKQNGWSLELLADKTGLTKSYLSKVERGLSVPSIAVALKLAAALQVDVEQLFAGGQNAAMISVTRAARRVAVPGAGGKGGYASIAADVGPKRLLPFMVYPPADFVASAFKEHAGDEFLFVHSGAVEIEFPDETVRLEVGDSLYFNAMTPHRVRSVGPTQAEILLVVSNTPDA